ncbi:Hypothetical Protein FCC1311_118412, partial [Hondaea fermentalgiana]
SLGIGAPGLEALILCACHEDLEFNYIGTGEPAPHIVEDYSKPLGFARDHHIVEQYLQR